jgi:hypothetical protein
MEFQETSPAKRLFKGKTQMQVKEGKQFKIILRFYYKTEGSF